MARILDFTDGFTSVTSPSVGAISANQLPVFANDAAFETANGAGQEGDIYFNSTDNLIHVHDGVAWVAEALDSSVVHKAGIETITGAKTFSANVVINADLTVAGTTTTVNSTNLVVADKNIFVNSGGNDASAEGSGITVDRTGTDGSFVYDSTLASKWKIGNLGSESQVVTVDGTQSLTNKTIDGDDNFVTDLALTALKTNLTDASKFIVRDASGIPVSNTKAVPSGVVVGTTDSQTLTNKVIDADLNTISNIEDADIKSGANISRAKLASGTANHVIINDGSGVLSSEAQLAISRGGTNGSTATTGFNNLSPLTTKGDLVTHNNTNNIRQAVGTDGFVLTADSAQASGIKWAAASGAFDTSAVHVDSGNGHGSTADKIRRWSNIRLNSGAAITYADSATAGGTFTINSDGVYSISYNDFNSAAATRIGITVNDTATTTSIGNPLTYAQGLRAYSDPNTTSAVAHCSVTLYLLAGDVIRAHTNGTPDSTNTTSMFFVSRVR
jgi:hypothetical protein